MVCSFNQMIRKTRDPLWNEEFQFMLDEPPLNEKIHIEVISKRSGISFRSKVGFFLFLYHFLPSDGRHLSSTSIKL